MAKPTRSILILFVKKRTKAHNREAGQHAFVEALKRHLPEGTEVEFSFYDDLIYRIENGQASVWDTRTQRDVADYDTVQFRFWHGAGEQAGALATYLKKKRVLFYDKEVGDYRSKSKLTQYFKLWSANIPVPDTMFVKAHIADEALKMYPTFALPLVVKDTEASKGKNNFLLKTRSAVVQQLAAQPDVNYVIQRFIPNDGDWRVLVFGTKVRGAIFRQRTSKQTHLNNTSQDGVASFTEPEDLSPAVTELALKAAKVFNRQIAGVDVVEDAETHQLSIFEVNDTPQIDTGTYVDEKVAAMATFLTVPKRRIVRRKIASTVRIDFPTLGIKSVRAKVDTGANLSAIHTHRNEVDPKTGELVFWVLDPEHPEYVAKPIRTHDFKQEGIKNSSGLLEHRYIVTLPIRYREREYEVQFSLADRKRMLKPVLLGRRFLHDGHYSVKLNKRKTP